MNNRNLSNIRQIVDEYSTMLLKISYSYTKNREDSEDILQEVFIKFCNQDDFVDDNHIRSWLVRVVINDSINYIKSAYKRRQSGQEVDINQISGLNHSSDKDGDELINIVTLLPEKYRAAIYLYYYEEYSVEEIATMLGKRKQGVYTMLKRGRALLKKMIEEGGSLYE